VIRILDAAWLRLLTPCYGASLRIGLRAATTRRMEGGPLPMPLRECGPHGFDVDGVDAPGPLARARLSQLTTCVPRQGRLTKCLRESLYVRTSPAMGWVSHGSACVRSVTDFMC
jgi:hypothetical protein